MSASRVPVILALKMVAMRAVPQSDSRGSFYLSRQVLPGRFCRGWEVVQSAGSEGARLLWAKRTMFIGVSCIGDFGFQNVFSLAPPLLTLYFEGGCSAGRLNLLKPFVEMRLTTRIRISVIGKRMFPGGLILCLHCALALQERK